jgi:hypothetical protein
MTPRLARWLPWLRAAGFVGAVVLVGAVAVRALGDVGVDELRWPLLPALGAAILWWLLLACGWSVVFDGRLRRHAVATWCRTQALRYLPGGFWAPASRAVLVKGTVVDRLATVGAENAIALGAALAVGGVAFAGSGDWRWAPLALAVAAPLVAARVVARRTRLTGRRALNATAVYLPAFAAYAVAAVSVQAAVSGLEAPLAVAGAASVAWAAGLVVVIAPGGLGVREVAYVALLAPTLPTAEAAAAAVTLRVVTIAAELVVLVAFGLPGTAASADATDAATVPIDRERVRARPGRSSGERRSSEARARESAEKGALS